MDSNFEGNNMEQWQQVENSPFDEMEELPIPASDNEDEAEQATQELTAEQEEERKRAELAAAEA